MTRSFLTPMILLTFLILAAPLSGCIGVFEPDATDSDSWEWIDPVTEIEDGNHSHNDLLAHRLATPNAQLGLGLNDSSTLTRLTSNLPGS